MSPPVAHEVRDPRPGEVPDGVVRLSHEDSLLRRRRLVTEAGEAFLADLPQTVAVAAGQVFVLSNGRLIGMVPAEEDLLEVRGDLARLAWHIGNRHTPCQIEADRIVIRADKVMRGMLAGLGAEIQEIRAPFSPEGGAYGPGRTMGHSHGHHHSHDHGGPHLDGDAPHDHHGHDHHDHGTASTRDPSDKG